MVGPWSPALTPFNSRCSTNSCLPIEPFTPVRIISVAVVERSPAINHRVLAKACSAAVNGIKAYPVKVEVNAGWSDTIRVDELALTGTITPTIYRPSDR